MSGRPDSAGSSQASALISAICAGGERPAPGQASAPHPTQAVLLRTIVAATYAHTAQSHRVRERSSIGLSLSSEQHDLRANHFTMRTGVPASSMAQLPLLGLAPAGTYFRRDD